MMILRRLVFSLLLVAAALAIFTQFASDSFAAQSPIRITVDGCANDPANDQGLAIFEKGLTTKLITCIKGTLQNAVALMLETISDYMKPLVTVLMTFAVIVFGMRILSGEKNIKSRAAGFLIRMGLVVAFSYNLGNMSGQVFGVFDDMTALVSKNAFLVSDPYNAGQQIPGSAPWEQMDHFLGVFLGFASGVTLIQGLMGIISGVMFSSTAGILMFITGVMAILNIFFFVIRVIFVYLTAYLIVAFLVVISPFVIPMALFYWTERYFTKWLHILLSAIITPMMLFAFLGMFLNIFSQLIGELFCPLGFKITDLLLINPDPAMCRPELGVQVVDAAHPVDFRAFFRMNQPLISWLMPGEGGNDSMLQDITNTSQAGTAAVQSNINPMARRAMNAGSFGTPGVDFGPNTLQTVQSMVFAFIKLWIFGTIMTAMVKKIPAIASDIAGINSVSNIGSTSLERTTMRGMNTFKDRFSMGLKDKNEFYEMAKREIRPY